MAVSALMPRLPKPDQCRGCIGDEWVHPIPGTKRFTEPHTGFSHAEGACTSGVHVIGEALGATEDAEGLPFRPQAQAGSLLQRAFQRLGYNRDMFRIHNICRCRPPHDLLSDTTYEFDVIQHCRPYLLNELATSRPRCILALGGTAARELTGLSGKAASVTYTRGYVLPCILPGFDGVSEKVMEDKNWDWCDCTELSQDHDPVPWSKCPKCSGTGKIWTTVTTVLPAQQGPIPVIPTYHPSFLRQGKPQYFGVLCADIKKAVDVARVGGDWLRVERLVAEKDYSSGPDIPF